MNTYNPKILYFHMEYPPITGGGASYTKNLIIQLTQLKIKIVLVTSGAKDSVEKIGDYLTIKRYKVFQDLYYDNGGLLQGVDVLLQQIRDESPDILHTVYIEETLIGQIANLNYGIPHIVTHTKTPMYREESIKKNSTWSLFDYVNRNNSISYITPGLAYRDSLLQTGVNGDSIHLIYPGIDQNIFRKIHDKQILNLMRTKLKIQPQDSVILVPCMLRKRKGLRFIAESLSKLTVPGHNIKVIITGIPRSQEEILIYQDIKKQIGNIEMVEHDRFSDEDMPILYNIAAVTVLCSEAEGYGTVFLEAMACECPTIGSDVIGINEPITNLYNGILCKYGDCDALNIAISKILTDTITREKFIKNSLQVLKSRYNLQKQAKNHLKLYRSYCDNKQKTICVLYRNAESKVEVFLVKNSKSNISLPKIFKRKNESWLEAAITKARKVSGYQVLIPSHLILDEKNINNVVYSFKITLTTHYTKSKYSKSYPEIWLNLDKAILKIKNEDERSMLQELKKKLILDNHIRVTLTTN